jgi:hypothetical protein
MFLRDIVANLSCRGMVFRRDSRSGGVAAEAYIYVYIDAAEAAACCNLQGAGIHNVMLHSLLLVPSAFLALLLLLGCCTLLGSLKTGSLRVPCGHRKD